MSSPGRLSLSEQWAILAQLPLQLSSTSEHEIFTVAASQIVSVFPSVQYVRIVLVSDSLTPTDVWDLCQDKRVLHSMEQLAHSTRTSQLMALQQKQLLSTALLSPTIYDDWHLLNVVYGMCSMAAVPLCFANTAYGVMLLASSDQACITKETTPALEAAGSMLAPYAAMMRKHQKLQVARQVLELMLPPRVVAAISERVGWGNNLLELQH